MTRDWHRRNDVDESHADPADPGTN
jgi:hypothetical protein